MSPHAASLAEQGRAVQVYRETGGVIDIEDKMLEQPPAEYGPEDEPPEWMNEDMDPGAKDPT